MRDFEEGYATQFVATILSGLLCGLLWEAWNYLSVSKWVYSVPFLEDVKIFEMPVPGYIGFLVFGLETMTFVNFLDGIKSYKSSIPIVALISILFSALSFTLIDRHTVFSCAPEIEDIAFIGKEKLNYFKQIGVEFTEYNVQEDESAMQVLVDKNIMSVPFIMIDDVELIGFDKDKIDEALGRY
jgi:glutaredoxin